MWTLHCPSAARAGRVHQAHPNAALQWYVPLIFLICVLTGPVLPMGMPSSKGRTQCCATRCQSVLRGYRTDAQIVRVLRAKQSVQVLQFAPLAHQPDAQVQHLVANVHLRCLTAGIWVHQMVFQQLLHV